MKDTITSLIGTLFLFAGLAFFCSVAFGSLGAGTLAALVVMALRGFLTPAFGPAREGRHPLPDPLTRARDSLVLLVDQMVFLAGRVVHRFVIVHDTHARLGPARPLIPAGVVA